MGGAFVFDARVVIIKFWWRTAILEQMESGCLIFYVMCVQAIVHDSPDSEFCGYQNGRGDIVRCDRRSVPIHYPLRECWHTPLSV
jgi:hypothetical protein